MLKNIEIIIIRLNMLNYNPNGWDCANFVSQCLIKGRLNLVKICGSDAAWGMLEQSQL